ncbi:hypothetical protein ACW910_22580 (plasmid) [Burkholderia ambifaria]
MNRTTVTNISKIAGGIALAFALAACGGGDDKPNQGTPVGWKGVVPNTPGNIGRPKVQHPGVPPKSRPGVPGVLPPASDANNYMGMFDLYSMGGVPSIDNPGALVGTDLSGLLQNGGLLVSSRSQDPNVDGVLWTTGDRGYSLIMNNSTGKIISANTAVDGVRLVSSGEDESIVAVCRAAGGVDGNGQLQQITTESFGMWSEQGDFPKQHPLVHYVMTEEDAAVLFAMVGPVSGQMAIGGLATCSATSTALMRTDPIGYARTNKDGGVVYGRLSLNNTFPKPQTANSGTVPKEAAPGIIAAAFAPKLTTNGIVVGAVDSRDKTKIETAVAISMSELKSGLSRGPGSVVAFNPDLLLPSMGVNPDGGVARAYVTGAIIGATGVILLHVEGTTGDQPNPNTDLKSKSPFSYTLPFLIGNAPILSASGEPSGTPISTIPGNHPIMPSSN